jgi:hypothetical protein
VSCMNAFPLNPQRTSKAARGAMTNSTPTHKEC